MWDKRIAVRFSWISFSYSFFKFFLECSETQNLKLSSDVFFNNKIRKFRINRVICRENQTPVIYSASRVILMMSSELKASDWATFGENLLRPVSFFVMSSQTSVCLTSFRLMWCFMKRSLTDETSTGLVWGAEGRFTASCVFRQCPAEGVRQQMIPPKAVQDPQPLRLQQGTSLAFNLIGQLRNHEPLTQYNPHTLLGVAHRGNYFFNVSLRRWKHAPSHGPSRSE